MKTIGVKKMTIKVVGNKRDLTIDFLRSIALLGIMLVHVKPWVWLEQIRDFDVPLMVFLSAVVYTPIAHGWGEYFDYCKKRFVRLIVPAWIFIIMLYLMSFAISRPMRVQTLLELLTFQTTWYVWIIRVFFVIAIFAPYISYIVDRLSIPKCLMVCLAILIISELIYDDSCNFTTKLIFIQIPYFVVFAMGYAIRRFREKNVLVISLVSAIVFILYATVLYYQTGTFIPTGQYKYPPQIYYLSYAMSVILLLWTFRGTLYKVSKNFFVDKILCFMGSHSLWIYFWHVIVLLSIQHFKIHFIFKYIVVVSIALLITYAQSSIVKKMQAHFKNETLRQNIKRVLDC